MKKECKHNWFNDNFKNATVCDVCGISYNEYIHNKERKELEEIKGRSFNVCQECYDKRQSHQRLTYTDKIVPKDECAICGKTNL